MSLLSDARKRAKHGTTPMTLPKSSPIFEGHDDFWELLNGVTGDNNKHMPGCRLSVYMEDGKLKCCINDPITNRVAFLGLDEGKTLGQAIIEHLDGQSIEWRNGRGKRPSVDTHS